MAEKNYNTKKNIIPFCDYAIVLFCRFVLCCLAITMFVHCTFFFLFCIFVVCLLWYTGCGLLFFFCCLCCFTLRFAVILHNMSVERYTRYKRCLKNIFKIKKKCETFCVSEENKNTDNKVSQFILKTLVSNFGLALYMLAKCLHYCQ